MVLRVTPGPAVMGGTEREQGRRTVPGDGDEFGDREHDPAARRTIPLTDRKARTHSERQTQKIDR